MAIDLPEPLKRLNPNYQDDYIRRSADEGKRWGAIPDLALPGIVGEHGHEAVREACAVEMQRRLVAAIREFNMQSGTQTKDVITLTEKLHDLTVVLERLTIAAVVFGGIQAVAILVHLYRWYRGWL